MWAAYWLNYAGPAMRSLSIQDRSKLINRCVKPVLLFRCTRWPYTRALAEEQNRVQRRMLSYFIQFQRSPLDDDTYFRKTMRFVANIARLSGAWGTEHAQRIVSWREHLKRPRN